MIAVVSNSARERTAFAALCASRGWSVSECDGVRATLRLIERLPPRVILARHKLADGYSDDILATLATMGLAMNTRVIVLIAAGSPTSIETRQISLGADCVQRDPVRTDVLVEYLAKYVASAQQHRRDVSHAPREIAFASAVLHVADRRLVRARKAIRLTPREASLAEILVRSTGEVVSYDRLYLELLGRRPSGDTSNMRVLLGKLSTSAARIGIAVREWIEVIPKMGYRYNATPPSRPK